MGGSKSKVPRLYPLRACPGWVLTLICGEAVVMKKQLSCHHCHGPNTGLPPSLMVCLPYTLSGCLPDCLTGCLIGRSSGFRLCAVKPVWLPTCWTDCRPECLLPLFLLCHLNDPSAGRIRVLALTNFDTIRLQKVIEAGVPIASNQVGGC